MGNWCPFCTGSSGENAVASYLAEKNIPYRSQTTIPGLARKRYDFIFEYKGIKTIVEYDGEMHFKFIQYYHVNQDFFNHRQAVDRVKTLNALNNGYRMIRIDYSHCLNVRKQLDTALELTGPLYVSTPNMYQGWLLGAPVPPEEWKEVETGRSRPDYREDADDTNEMVKVTDRFLQLVIKKE
jgi:very-short-patch-repair endonuclease